MRLTVVFFFFLMSVSCFAQEKEDSVAMATSEPEWSAKDYSQEDKIFNRSVWTFTDNPALAGFDRKLAASYRFRMKNLSMGVPNEEGNLELAFMKHEAFLDYAFGGTNKNWGVGAYYAFEKELQHTYHRVLLTHSYRVKIQDHQLILGMGFGGQFSNLNDWNKLMFGDMIEPRNGAGFIYQTQQPKPSTNKTVAFTNLGLRYTWRRLFFDYAFQYGPNGAFALMGFPSLVFKNSIHVGYHFKVDDEITITPEFAAVIRTTAYPVGKGLMKTSNNYGLYSAFVTVTYKDMLFGQLGMADQNRMTLQLGYQLKNLLVIHIGASSYFVRHMREIGGIASAEIGIRAQIRTTKK